MLGVSLLTFDFETASATSTSVLRVILDRFCATAAAARSSCTKETAVQFSFHADLNVVRFNKIKVKFVEE